MFFYLRKLIVILDLSDFFFPHWMEKPATLLHYTSTYCFKMECNSKVMECNYTLWPRLNNLDFFFFLAHYHTSQIIGMHCESKPSRIFLFCCFFQDGNLTQVCYSQHQQSASRFLYTWHASNAVSTASLSPFLILPLCNYVSGRATQIKPEGFIGFHCLAYNLDHFHSNPTKTHCFICDFRCYFDNWM